MKMLNQNEKYSLEPTIPAQPKMSDLTQDIRDCICSIYTRISIMHDMLSRISDIGPNPTISCKSFVNDNPESLHDFLGLLHQDTIQLNNIFDNINDQLVYKI